MLFPARSWSWLWSWLKRHVAQACFLGMLTLFCGTLIAHAASPLDVFDQLLNKPSNAYIPTGTGEFGFVEFALAYARIFGQIVMVMAVILMVIQGFTMIRADGDAAVIKKAGATIGWILGGIIVINVAEVGVNVFFKSTGLLGGIDPIDRDIPQDFYNRIVLPLIRFTFTFLAGIATLMIVVTGVRILTAGGDDTKIKKHYTTLATLLTGLLIIIIARPLVAIFYGTGRLDPEPSQAIALVLQILNYVFGFLGLAAILVIIGAGLMFVFFLGNDGIIKKARTAIFGALLGLALIISAYTIATFFIVPVFQ